MMIKMRHHITISERLEAQKYNKEDVSIFDITHHLIKARTHIPTDKIVHVVELLLEAANKAQKLFDYDLSLNYLDIITEIKKELSNEKGAIFAYEVSFFKAECYYFKNNISKSKEMFSTLLNSAISEKEKTNIVIKLYKDKTDLISMIQYFDSVRLISLKKIQSNILLWLNLEYKYLSGIDLSYMQLRSKIIRVDRI